LERDTSGADGIVDKQSRKGGKREMNGFKVHPDARAKVGKVEEEGILVNTTMTKLRWT